MPTPTASPSDGTPNRYSHLPAQLEAPTTREGLRLAALEARRRQMRSTARRMLQNPEICAARNRFSSPGETSAAPRQFTSQGLQQFGEWLKGYQRKKLDRARGELQHAGRKLAETQLARRAAASPPASTRGHAPRRGSNARTKGSHRGASAPKDSDSDPPSGPRPRGLKGFPAPYAGARSCPVCSDPIPEYDPETGRKKRSDLRTCGKEPCSRQERRDRRREEADRERRTKGQYVPFKIGCGCIERRSDGLPRTPYVDEDAFLRCRDCERLATQHDKVVELSATYLRKYDRAKKLDGKAPPLNPDTDLVPLEARKLMGADLQRTWAGDRLSCATWKGWLDASISQRPETDATKDEAARGDKVSDPRNPLRDRVLENRSITLHTFPRSGHRRRSGEVTDLPIPGEAEAQKAAAHGDDLELSAATERRAA